MLNTIIFSPSTDGPSQGYTYYAQKNEDAVIAVIEALHEATRALRERPEEVYAVFAQASVKSLTQMFEVLQKCGIVKADKPVGPAMQELVHPEFVEKVLAKSR